MDSVLPNTRRQMHAQLIRSLNCITLFSTAQLQDGFCFIKHVSQLLCTQQACEVIGFVDWLDRGLMYKICEKSLEMCICLWPEFDCPEVTLCGWQDIKIQLQLRLPNRHGLLCPKKKADTSTWVVTKAMEQGLEVITSTVRKIL